MEPVGYRFLDVPVALAAVSAAFSVSYWTRSPIAVEALRTLWAHSRWALRS